MGEHREVTMTGQEIEDLANAALDAACLVIQDRVGVKTGDLASRYFSDDVALDELKDYIRSELNITEDEMLAQIANDKV